MKLPSPYKCDYCPNVKSDGSKWFLRIPQAGGQVAYTTDAFLLLLWDETMAADAVGIEHVCGQECAAKALAKWMAAQ